MRQGDTVVVTVRGNPVARIEPFDQPSAMMLAARQRLFAQLRRQRAGQCGGWTRDELYEDEE